MPTLSLAELRERHSGEVEEIVEGYIARGQLVFLAGAGESFKSWIAAHLTAAADGKFKWMGKFEVHAERVLFVEQERAGNLFYQLNRIEIGERATLGSERLLIIRPTTLALSEESAHAALRAVVEDFKPDLVIINAFRDVLGRANENSPTDVAALLRPLGRLAEDHNLAVVIIDHFNKGGLLGVLRGTAAHAGTAQKHSEADTVLVAERPRDELGKGFGDATSRSRSGAPARSGAVHRQRDGYERRRRVGARGDRGGGRSLIPCRRRRDRTTRRACDPRGAGGTDRDAPRHREGRARGPAEAQAHRERRGDREVLDLPAGRR